MSGSKPVVLYQLSRHFSFTWFLFYKGMKWWYYSSKPLRRSFKLIKWVRVRGTSSPIHKTTSWDRFLPEDADCKMIEVSCIILVKILSLQTFLLFYVANLLLCSADETPSFIIIIAFWLGCVWLFEGCARFIIDRLSDGKGYSPAFWTLLGINQLDCVYHIKRPLCMASH